MTKETLAQRWSDKTNNVIESGIEALLDGSEVDLLTLINEDVLYVNSVLDLGVLKRNILNVSDVNKVNVDPRMTIEDVIELLLMKCSESSKSIIRLESIIALCEDPAGPAHFWEHNRKVVFEGRAPLITHTMINKYRDCFYYVTTKNDSVCRLMTGLAIAGPIVGFAIVPTLELLRHKRFTDPKHGYHSFAEHTFNKEATSNMEAGTFAYEETSTVATLNFKRRCFDVPTRISNEDNNAATA